MKLKITIAASLVAALLPLSGALAAPPPVSPMPKNLWEDGACATHGQSYGQGQGGFWVNSPLAEWCVPIG